MKHTHMNTWNLNQEHCFLPLPIPEKERVLDCFCIALFSSKLKLQDFGISHHTANFLLLRLFGATFTQFSLGHDQELVRP